jgi:hypothetical protein
MAVLDLNKLQIREAVQHSIDRSDPDRNGPDFTKEATFLSRAFSEINRRKTRSTKKQREIISRLRNNSNIPERN